MAHPSHRFSQRVDNYIKYRPHYPPELLDLLRRSCGLAGQHVIADVGSGTGLLAELFLRNGNRVFGIEPDPDMRAGATSYLRDYPAYAAVQGTAEATTLPNSSVDFVTAGQSFHWFDLPRARREFARILVPGGWVVVVWNVQKAAGKPFLEDLQRFWQDKRFRKPSRWATPSQTKRAQAYRLNDKLAETELLEPFFGPGGYRQQIFQNPLACDLEGLIGRVLSNGTALEPGDAHYPAMLAALEALFEAHQQDGRVTIEHDTRVVYGRLAPTR